MSVTIKGLDKLQRELKDAQRALQSLNGTLATVKFDPDDPASVQAAIREMEAAIDRKVAPYRNNALVKELVKAAKEDFRQQIRKQKK